MTNDQAIRLKAYIVQVICHPKLTTIQKMEKAEEFIDKITEEK